MAKFQNLYFFIILFFFASSVFAQSKSNGDTEWTRIKDDKSDFSILFPSNFLVDNKIEKSFIIAPILASLPEVIDSFEKPKIIGNQKSVQMSLSIYQLRQVSNAKNYLWYFVGRDTPKNNYQDFEIGDFVGRKTTFDTEKNLAMSVAVAIKNKIYLINASARNEDEKTYEKFVMSLMLNGKPLFKSQTSEPTDAPQSVFISTLQTSPEILKALNQKQEKSEIKVVKSTLAPQVNKDERNFSRPLILLRQPYFEFIDSASRSKSAGIVKLEITFLANGTIGNIVTASDLSDSLTKSAIKAAQKIKFLPAEIDGKRVDVTRPIEYAFNVH